mmetsp:Transcript_9206/g.16846  ORF Transcript_9206/g.16846 Transcript_9206/m.16846 type:complete len:350 (+) Transcript_9206:406-1455(+)
MSDAAPCFFRDPASGASVGWFSSRAEKNFSEFSDINSPRCFSDSFGMLKPPGLRPQPSGSPVRKLVGSAFHSSLVLMSSMHANASASSVGVCGEEETSGLYTQDAYMMAARPRMDSWRSAKMSLPMPLVSSRTTQGGKEAELSASWRAAEVPTSLYLQCIWLFSPSPSVLQRDSRIWPSFKSYCLASSSSLLVRALRSPAALPSRGSGRWGSLRPWRILRKSLWVVAWTLSSRKDSRVPEKQASSSIASLARLSCTSARMLFEERIQRAPMSSSFEDSAEVMTLAMPFTTLETAIGYLRAAAISPSAASVRTLAKSLRHSLWRDEKHLTTRPVYLLRWRSARSTRMWCK